MDEKRTEEEARELTPEEIDNMIFEEQIASGEHNEKVPEYYFSNRDPYAKVEPRPDGAPKRDIKFDENGNIVVKNPSAFWLPEVTIVDEIGGAEYTVTGSYEGTETLDKKLKRIMEQNAADDESDITEDMNSDTSLDINNHSNPVQTVAQPNALAAALSVYDNEQATEEEVVTAEEGLKAALDQLRAAAGDTEDPDNSGDEGNTGNGINGQDQSGQDQNNQNDGSTGGSSADTSGKDNASGQNGTTENNSAQKAVKTGDTMAPIAGSAAAVMLAAAAGVIAYRRRRGTR